jgi:hypothetical protein
VSNLIAFFRCTISTSKMQQARDAVIGAGLARPDFRSSSDQFTSVILTGDQLDVLSHNGIKYVIDSVVGA